VIDNDNHNDDFPHGRPDMGRDVGAGADPDGHLPVKGRGRRSGLDTTTRQRLDRAFGFFQGLGRWKLIQPE